MSFHKIPNKITNNVKCRCNWKMVDSQVISGHNYYFLDLVNKLVGPQLQVAYISEQLFIFFHQLHLKLAPYSPTILEFKNRLEFESRF